MNTSVKRGSIYFVDFGEEKIVGIQSGIGRPALIISNNIANRYSQSVICLSISGSTRKNFPVHVELTNDDLTKGKIKFDYSVVQCEQIHIRHKHIHIGDFIGQINENKMKDIEKALLIQLGIQQCKGVS